MTNKKRKFAKNDIVKLSTKPATSPSGQTATLSQPAFIDFAPYVKAGLMFISNPNNFIIDRVAVHLLLSFGLRISEVLSINPAHIKKDGSIYISGKKGSQPRLINPGKFAEWVANNPVYFCSMLGMRNRQYYWRLFNRLGISILLPGNKHRSVTHLFRYNFINEVQNISGEIEATGVIVGHKNKSNTKRYEQKTRK